MADNNLAKVIEEEAYQNLVDFNSEEYEKRMRKFRALNMLGLVVKFAFLIILALFILIPFFWMFSMSLQTKAETDVGVFWTAQTFYNWWNNYREVFKKSSIFLIYFLNTIVVSFSTTILVLITTVFAAFAFARLRFKGKELIFGCLLITMMVPGEMMIITNYLTISSWGWMNTYQALILPFSVSVFYIFFLRQSFQSIPNELYLAAKVDGYGDFKYLFKVMLPIAVSSIVTIVILGLMGSWNAYIWPTLVANGNYQGKIDNWTMQMVGNGLMAIFTGEFSDENNMKMAASAVITAPLLVFFIVFRKVIMRGVSRSGIKG